MALQLPLRLAIAILMLGVAASCAGSDRRLQQHQQKLESLGSSVAAIGEAWLAGHVSGTYTRTAFEQTFMLVEQERTALARAPEALADPRAARLTEAADRLSRLLAAMTCDVQLRDATALRRRLTQIPLYPHQQP